MVFEVVDMGIHHPSFTICSVFWKSMSIVNVSLSKKHISWLMFRFFEIDANGNVCHVPFQKKTYSSWLSTAVFPSIKVHKLYVDFIDVSPRSTSGNSKGPTKSKLAAAPHFGKGILAPLLGDGTAVDWWFAFKPTTDTWLNLVQHFKGPVWVRKVTFRLPKYTFGWLLGWHCIFWFCNIQIRFECPKDFVYLRGKRQEIEATH